MRDELTPPGFMTQEEALDNACNIRDRLAADWVVLTWNDGQWKAGVFHGSEVSGGVRVTNHAHFSNVYVATTTPDGEFSSTAHNPKQAVINLAMHVEAGMVSEILKFSKILTPIKEAIGEY